MSRVVRRRHCRLGIRTETVNVKGAYSPVADSVGVVADDAVYSLRRPGHVKDGYLVTRLSRGTHFKK